MPVKRKGDLRTFEAKVENGQKRGLILSGKVVAQRAQMKAPRLTGRLKRSLHEGKPYSVRKHCWGIDIGSDVEYARPQELGSGIYAEGGGGEPIIIRPVKKKALAFEWLNAPEAIKEKFSRPRADGSPGPWPTVIFAQVSHPGVKPQPYLRPALAESKKEIPAIILTSIVGAVRA